MGKEGDGIVRLQYTFVSIEDMKRKADAFTTLFSEPSIRLGGEWRTNSGEPVTMEIGALSPVVDYISSIYAVMQDGTKLTADPGAAHFVLMDRS